MIQTTLKNNRAKSLEYSIKDGTAFSVMTGFGEQYFSPFAIELGAGNTEIGLLASVPQFAASIFQLWTSKTTAFFKSRKKTILIFVMLQALTWIPLALIAFYAPIHGVYLLIALVCLYFIFGQFAGPAWNSLIGDLVNEDSRGRFFGMRNRITGTSAFISLLIAGYALSVFSKVDIFYGYALIFAVAFVARLVSWHYLNKTEDPPTIPERLGGFSYAGYLKRLRKTNYGRFALYFALMNFSVNVAAPFFTVYMLRDLGMSYLDYTLITASSALTSFLAMAYWGPIADRFGNKKILSFSGITLTLVPLFWLFSADVAYLILAQLVSGFFWAGFNLSSLNFVYDNVKPAKRTRVFAYHNVLTGTSIFLGALTGSMLAATLTTPAVFSSSLQTLFLISGLMRAAASLFFLPRIREKRDVEYITSRDFFIKYGGTGPIMGLTYGTVIGLHRTLKKIKKDKLT